jgi:hypothetical protein
MKVLDNNIPTSQETAEGFSLPQSIGPHGQSMGQKNDQFSPIQHRNQSILRPEWSIDPQPVIQSPSSARSDAGQANIAFKPITSEHDLLNALREHRAKERRSSDYPRGNQYAQMALVKEIIGAFRNVDGCLDNQKVVSSYNGTYSDRQIEIAAWQIMVCDLDLKVLE